MNTSQRAKDALYKLIFLERRDIFSVTIYAVGIGLFSLVVPIGVQAIVNNIAFAKFNQPIVFMLFAVLCALGLAGLFRILQTIVVEQMQVRLFARSAIHLTQRIPNVDFEKIRFEHQGMTLPQWVNRFFDILTVQKSVASLLLDGMSLVLQGLIGLILLAFYHPALLAFDLLLLTMLFFTFFVLGRGLVLTSIQESYEKHKVLAWLEDLAEKYILFRSPVGRKLAYSRGNDLVQSYIDARKIHFHRFLRQIIAFVVIQIFASVLLLALGAWLVTKNQLTLGQLVASELVVTSVLTSILKFEKHLDQFYDLLASLDKLQSLNDLPMEQEWNLPTQMKPREGPAKLEFKSVDCLSATNNKLITSFSCKILPGEKILIYGDHGSGKSTLSGLCYGLLSANSGSVLLDDRDIRGIPKGLLRSEIALLRNTEVMTDTIFQNIVLGRQDVSLDDVATMLEQLGVYEDILRLPHGLHTKLHADGIPLSHLQTQMIVLARSLLTRPRLLVIDQFLDELDEIRLKKSCEQIFSDQRSWTVLVTSNKKSIEDYVDRCYELKKGSIQS